MNGQGGSTSYLVKADDDQIMIPMEPRHPSSANNNEPTREDGKEEEEEEEEVDLPPSKDARRKDSLAMFKRHNNNNDDNDDDNANGNGASAAEAMAAVESRRGPGELDTDRRFSRPEIDYEADYQTVLKLKQQMETNEANPLRRTRRSPFSGLSIKQPKRPKECKLLAFVVLLFIVIIVGLVVIYRFHEEEFYFIHRGHRFVANEKTLDVTFENEAGRTVLKGHLWRTRPHGRLPYDCSEEAAGADEHGRGGGLCLLWKRLEKLSIHRKSMNETNVTCHDVMWTALATDVSQMDCFELDDGHWYGGGIDATMMNSWPLERTSISKRRFVTSASTSSSQEDVRVRGGFGPVVERYFLSSNGVAVVVERNSALRVSINAFDAILNRSDHQLCIYSDYDSRPTTSYSSFGIPSSSKDVNRYTGLNYTICVADDVRRVHEVALPMAVGEEGRGGNGRPPKSVFSNPVWSTWSYFKDDYNQTSLIDYAAEINRSGIGYGLLMLDDGWEERYGDLSFPASKFPDPRAMVDSLQKTGFAVSLWSHPQLNIDSQSFQDATRRGYLVRDVGGDVPGLTRWWNGPRSGWDRGVAGMIDVSGNASSAWQRERLEEFKNRFGVDTFHFSGGDVRSLPTRPTFSGGGSSNLRDPNDYTRANARLATSFGDLVSVRSAYDCQDLPVLIRLDDGTSTWTGSVGLQSIIPTVLTLGLLGYPFFIPEAVGGSAFDGFPSKELYIRWLQLSAFLPVLHFSIPPRHYDDDETTAVAMEMLRIRKDLVEPVLDGLVDEAFETRTPIVRPIWWTSPVDEEALSSVTEFTVGDDVLVAPILEEGARQRDVYLPDGLWEERRDSLPGDNISIHVGPKWLRGYSVPLNKVAYFVRK